MKKSTSKDNANPRGWLTICIQGSEPFSIWIANIEKVKKEFKENAKKAGIKVKIFIDKNHGFPTADKLYGLKLGD